ncbi:ribosomal RNA large subunit methyltransferase (macronuclear) [Tetrahymena thermophila SB210]|uniref:Ribosomal RNA large subunit methyltransferase n=1 Tax=Tetrahymena thermophila (strain SB210) TaxID=312017 RepID=Q22E68_TETTS|nr:ribosomal RNA large subunit methyltransferase [Tetrahymena thermophila SB210]EAR83546.1 ribosomal RNA large subunit methyltransferase [Tetrahymena thermophila SB210]|eukprot:XP_001031209.1 ribosomal RNA large subunit methyltransferase [Tetrahymena thermophila SB210]
MSVPDLFDDSNRYYKEAVDDPLKIIEPLGMSFFNNRNNDKRPNPSDDQHKDRSPHKKIHSSNNEYQPNTHLAKKGNLKKLTGILFSKDEQLEKITYNRVQSIRTDMPFLEKIRTEQLKEQKNLIVDTHFKNSVTNFDRQEYIKQYNLIVDQIKMEQYSNLKVIKCQNLLKILTGFVKKNSQVSTFYHVYGSFENIGYIEYLKKDIELNMTTSILSVWLQNTPKLQNIKNSPNYHEIDMYIKETQDFNIDSGESVKSYINTLKEQAQEQDFSFEGFDLYLGLRSCPNVEGYLQQEKQCQKRMIFDLTMICNLLADQQNCVIKFYHTFSIRTLMILYLFSKIFQTVVMSKPRTSSFASNARYLHCTNFKIDIGRKMGEMFLEKYDEYIQDNLLFDLRILTQDTKFSGNFIEKFLQNLLRQQIDYFECDEVVNRKYADIVKQELKSIFSELYYKDITEKFQIEDLSLKRDLGIKEMNLDEARKQIEKYGQEQSQKEQQQDNPQTDQKQQKQNQPQFSDSEEDDEENKKNNESSFTNQFIENRRKKEEEERLKLEQQKDEKQRQNNVPPPKKDPNVINQIVDRDLNETKNFFKGLVPSFLIKKKK